MTANIALCQKNTDSLISELDRLRGIDRINNLNELAFALAPDIPKTALFYALEADSLSKHYNDLPEEAFAKRNLGDISLYKNDFETAQLYYNLALAIDKSIENQKGIADDLYNLAIVYEYRNEYNDALDYYTKAQAIYDSIGDRINSSNTLYNIGFLYDHLGENVKALAYYKQSIKTRGSLADEQDIAETLNSIGLLYYSWGDYESALEYYGQSLAMMEKANNKGGIAQTLNNLGILYYDWGQKDKALEYYLTSLGLEEETGNEAGLAASYNNIGIVYADLKDHYKALEYYQKALEIDEKYEDQTGIATCLNNIGELYFELGDQQQAIKFLEQSLKIERKLGNPEYLSVEYNTMAEFYHKMGEQKTALFYNDSSFRLSQLVNSPELLMDNYLLYFHIYESLGSYKHALDFNKKYHALQDSLFTQKSLKQISAMQSKYEVDQHEKEIELLNSKNQLQVLELENKQMTLRRQKILTYALMSGFTVLLFFVLLFYFQIRQKKKAYSMLDKKNKEILEKRSEIIEAKEKAEESDRIKSSFLANISHELRTPLNGILGFAEILQKELTDPSYKEMSDVIHFSGMRLLDTLNSIIDLSVIENNKMELYLTRFNVVDLISERVSLYNVIASNKNLEIVQHCQSDQMIVNSDPKVLTNILNNLVDNAVKYTKDGVVTVEAGFDDECQQPMFWIKVSDTGIGIPENRLDHIFDRFTQVSEGQNREYEGAGLGLTICKKYIELLQGSISVVSKPGIGSQFMIRLPASINLSHLQNATNDEHETRDSGDWGIKPKILFIDRDKENLVKMTKKLSWLCDIFAAPDQDTAMALAAEQNFDGIFIDFGLNADFNGKIASDVFHDFSNNEDTPITVIVSKSTSQDKLDRLLENGYSYYLSKPYTSDEIQDIVYEMISQNIKT
jgi:signal transduction histidine kinase/Tfp pilus assembly protein PilF